MQSEQQNDNALGSYYDGAQGAQAQIPQAQIPIIHCTSCMVQMTDNALLITLAQQLPDLEFQNRLRVIPVAAISLQHCQGKDLMLQLLEMIDAWESQNGELHTAYCNQRKIRSATPN